MFQRAYSTGTDIFIYPIYDINSFIPLQPHNINECGLPRIHGQEPPSSLLLPGINMLPCHAFLKRALEASCFSPWVPSWHWPCFCPPKHHNKVLLSLICSCFSFACSTKTQPCCSLLLSFTDLSGTHTGFPGQIWGSCLPDCPQTRLYLCW